MNPDVCARSILAAISLVVCGALPAAARPANVPSSLPSPVPVSVRAQSASRAPSFTVWFGGTDPETGLAMPGGLWDFEDGSMQGWKSFDRSNHPHYFRRRTLDDFEGDPIAPLIDGSPLLWVGAHARETECWPGGQGYGNDWGMAAYKTFTYGGGAVTITFDYFQDSETSWDFTYVRVGYAGETSDTLNSSAHPDARGHGYSGSLLEGTAIFGARDSIVISPAVLPFVGQPYDIEFLFVSDHLGSDTFDGTEGFNDSQLGAFGVDNFHILGSGIDETSTWNTGWDGWNFYILPPVGSLAQVLPLAELPPIPGELADCPLSAPGNDFVLAACHTDIMLGYPHPRRQLEELISPPAVVEGSFGTAVVEWSTYSDLPFETAVGYRPGLHYYPWTCSLTGIVGWTIEPVADPAWVIGGEPTCDTYGVRLGPIPADVESLRVSFMIASDCALFGPPGCDPPDSTNHSPYFDNIRIGGEVHEPGTMLVPGHYDSIQDALDAAGASGDTVLVSPGTYAPPPGNRPASGASALLDFMGKNVVVRSTDGPATTVLDCQGMVRGVAMTHGESRDAVLEGFTILDGFASGIAGQGGGILCRGSSPTLRNCWVIGCETDAGGGGVYGESGSPLIEGCRVAGNRGGGVTIRGGAAEIVSTAVTGNAGNATGGIEVDGGIHLLQNCTIAGNLAAQTGGAGGLAVINGASIDLVRSIVWWNCGPGPDDGLLAAGTTTSVDCSDIREPEFTVLGELDPGSTYIVSDPFFCGPDQCAEAPQSDGDYRIAANSPCLPAASPCALLIGALGGCGITGNPEGAVGVAVPHLAMNRPNPFASATTIEIQAPETAILRVDIFDVSGRMVRRLIDRRNVPPSRLDVAWDGRDSDGEEVAIGTYFYRLSTDAFTTTRRMTLVR